MRDGGRALFAVVQRSKDDAWVLPRGKLKRDEKPVIGARREVVEETGHRVRVHEFLGAITYRAGGRPKVVQFWRMEAEAEASHDLMTDIAAVEWLPLKAAVRRLSYPLEKLFLRNIGRQAMLHRQRALQPSAKKPTDKKANKSAGKPPEKKTAQKADKKTGKSAAKKAKKAMTKAAKKPATKPKQQIPARGPARKTGTHAVTPHARPVKLTKPRKTVQRKAASAKSTAAHAIRAKHTVHKPSLQKHSLHKPSETKSTAVKQPAPKRTAATAAVPERAFAPSPPKPKTAAERKSILQRMLGRLAG